MRHPVGTRVGHASGRMGRGLRMQMVDEQARGRRQRIVGTRHDHEAAHRPWLGQRHHGQPRGAGVRRGGLARQHRDAEAGADDAAGGVQARHLDAVHQAAAEQRGLAAQHRVHRATGREADAHFVEGVGKAQALALGQRM